MFLEVDAARCYLSALERENYEPPIPFHIAAIDLILSGRGCELESLSINSIDLSNHEWRCLFHALGTNTSLKVLDLGDTNVCDIGGSPVVDCLRQNDCLIRLSVDELETYQIPSVLTSDNSSLEDLYVEIRLTQINILPYLIRKWAGRQLLGHAPLGLWPFVMGQVSKIMTKYRRYVHDGEPICGNGAIETMLQADCTYRFIRNDGFLISAGNQKRTIRC